jgi:hypothetical protein
MWRNICYSKVCHLEGRLGCPIQIVYELLNDQPNQVFNVLGENIVEKMQPVLFFFINVRKIKGAIKNRQSRDTGNEHWKHERRQSIVYFEKPEKPVIYYTPSFFLIIKLFWIVSPIFRWAMHAFIYSISKNVR